MPYVVCLTDKKLHLRSNFTHIMFTVYVSSDWRKKYRYMSRPMRWIVPHRLLVWRMVLQQVIHNHAYRGKPWRKRHSRLLVCWNLLQKTAEYPCISEQSAKQRSAVWRDATHLGPEQVRRIYAYHEWWCIGRECNEVAERLGPSGTKKNPYMKKQWIS